MAICRRKPLTIMMIITWNLVVMPNMPACISLAVKLCQNKRSDYALAKAKYLPKKADIPARPWLGVNKQDEQKLLRKATALLQRQIEQGL